MQTNVIEDMRSRMLSVDETRKRIEYTEGLNQYEFDTDGSSKLGFKFEDGWNDGIEDKEDFQSVDAAFSIGDTEIPLTKNGALELASTVGLPKATAKETPANLLNPYLNYFYNNGGRGKAHLKMLASNSGGLGLTRASVQPFSNFELLNAVTQGIKDRAGVDESELMVDYKLNHGLADTNIRIILPSTREIKSVRGEKLGGDPWSLGIELNNSLQGLSSLELKGYLFALVCTNGMTVNHATSGRYRRKPSLTPEDAYVWAKHAVDDVFTDLGPALDDVESLTQIPLEGELTDTLGRMFERFQIPAALREPIIGNLAESDDLSAYGLLQAITYAANDEELSPGAVNTLLEAGGEVAHVLSERCQYCHRF